MKQLLFLFTCLCALSVSSQIKQNGVVKEYNEKLAKKPLSNVEVVATNAGSVITNNEGEFVLQFRTLKPGDKVNVRRIEKLGYEIFNKEALEQWNINPNEPFVIIMCRSDLFKRIRDNYTKVSSESYARQLKKEEEKLLKEKNEGKLNEEKYQQELNSLINQYNEQLENIDNYIDKFARIDLSELSEKEQQIIELVQKGNIEEAIIKYEEQNFLEQYQKETNDLKELKTAQKKIERAQEQKEKARSEIMNAIVRQYNSYILAGGRENYNKVTTLLNNLALADTTNADALIMYAKHSYKQRNFPEAIKFYNITLNNIKFNDNIRPKILENLAMAYEMNRNFSESKSCYEESLTSYKADTDEYMECILNMAGLYTKMAEHTKAIELYEKALAYYEEKDLSMYDIELLANHYERYAILSLIINDFDSAQNSILKSIEYLEKFDKKETETYKLSLYESRNSLGQLYTNLQKYENALEEFKKVDHIIDDLIKHNPKAYLSYKATNNGQLGILYFYLKKYEDSEKYFLSAIEILKEMMKSSPNSYLPSIAETYQNMGYLFYSIKEYAKGETYYVKAHDIFIELLKEYPTVYRMDIARVEVNMSSLYMDSNSIDKSLIYAQQAVNHLEKYYKDKNGFICDVFALALKNMSVCYNKQNQYEEAISNIDKAIELAPVQSVVCTKVDCYEKKGEMYLNKGDKNEAKKILKKILEINPNYTNNSNSEFYKSLSALD